MYSVFVFAKIYIYIYMYYTAWLVGSLISLTDSILELGVPLQISSEKKY